MWKGVGGADEHGLNFPRVGVGADGATVLGGLDERTELRVGLGFGFKHLLFDIDEATGDSHHDRGGAGVR